MAEPDLSEFHGLTELEELRKANATLQRQLRRAKAKTDDLVAATIQGSHDAMVALGPVAKIPKPRADKRARPEVALWHLTDWQGAKLTTSYNSDVMRERVMRYCDTAERLTEIKRAAIPVRECVILFGGDMGEGLFNFPNQPFEIDASIFSGDPFTDPKFRGELRRLMARWERGLKEFDRDALDEEYDDL